MAFDKRCRTEIILSQPSLSAGIDTSPVGGPQTHDEAPLPATRGAGGAHRLRGDDRRRLASAGVGRHDPQAERVGRYGTAGMLQAAVPAFDAAIGEHMLEEPTDTLQSVEVGDSRACTARCTRGESDRAVRARDDATLGESDPEDRGGEGGESSVSVVIGLTVDVPGDGPHLGSAVLQQSSLAQSFFEDGSVDR